MEEERWKQLYRWKVSRKRKTKVPQTPRKINMTSSRFSIDKKLKTEFFISLAAAVKPDDDDDDDDDDEDI